MRFACFAKFACFATVAALAVALTAPGAQADDSVTATATLSCGQITYTVQASAPVQLRAQDTPADTVPLVSLSWVAPAGTSTEIDNLPAATRPDGSDEVDLFSGPNGDVFVRTDDVQANCAAETPVATAPAPTPSVTRYDRAPAPVVRSAAINISMVRAQVAEWCAYITALERAS